jgi:hypothetical protein
MVVLREGNATGVVDTGKTSTVHNTVGKVPWAGIVKKVPAADATASKITTYGGDQSASRHRKSSIHRTFVLRSLSQNNPVNASKV